MKQVVIDNPVLTQPFDESRRPARFSDDAERPDGPGVATPTMPCHT